jgi:hypothetical protein
VGLVADFEKIASNKQLLKLEKDKKARLTKLDQEYKAGTISKESYEAQKASIEQDYDIKTRQVKKQAAEKEKQFNIAQAVIAGALAVIKASPNVPLMIAAGVTAAAGVAKIIATPIPEFEKGGFFNRLGQGAKHYATGGRLNARADVGQRHAGGGIRMVDGAATPTSRRSTWSMSSLIRACTGAGLPCAASSTFTKMGALRSWVPHQLQLLPVGGAITRNWCRRCAGSRMPCGRCLAGCGPSRSGSRATRWNWSSSSVT